MDACCEILFACVNFYSLYVMTSCFLNSFIFLYGPSSCHKFTIIIGSQQTLHSTMKLALLTLLLPCVALASYVDEAPDLTSAVGAPLVLAELAGEPKYCTNKKTDWQCYK